MNKICTSNMKSYTSVEQSRKLAEFLPLESADMYYSDVPVREWVDKTDVSKGTHVVFKSQIFAIENLREHKIGEGDTPAWSLSALMELMPTDDKKDEYYVDTESHSDYYTVSYRNCWDGCIHSEYSEESLLNAVFEMVCWLKENNKL